MTILQKHLVFVPLCFAVFAGVLGGIAMLLAELTGGDPALATNGIYHIVNTFHGIGQHSVMGYVYTLLYLVWLAALWFHLNHGIWSAMQTMGLNNKTWFPRLKRISTVYTSLLILAFAGVAVLFCLGYTPSDMPHVMP